MDKTELEAIKKRLNPPVDAVPGIPAGRMVGAVILPPATKGGEPRAYEIIEAVSPGPRLELFARAPRPGWDVWGNEVQA